MCLNGPAARLVAPGDQVIVIAYADMTPEEAAVHKPRVVLVDAENNPTATYDLDGRDVSGPDPDAGLERDRDRRPVVAQARPDRLDARHQPAAVSGRRGRSPRLPPHGSAWRPPPSSTPGA